MSRGISGIFLRQVNESTIGPFPNIMRQRFDKQVRPKVDLQAEDRYAAVVGDRPRDRGGAGPDLTFGLP